MGGKTVLGVLIAGVVLFVFGFVYWAMNPLPYAAANSVTDAAAVQSAAAALFPEDGFYMVPGPSNDPAALDLLKSGPSVLLSIDHSPTPGADPGALGTGFIHNLISALLLALLLRSTAGFAAKVALGTLLGVIATVVINGSEVIWWQQPLNWQLHHMIYYVLYFAIGATVLAMFLPDPSAAAS